MDRPRRSGRTSAATNAVSPPAPGTSPNGVNGGTLSRSPSTSSLGQHRFPQQQQQQQQSQQQQQQLHHQYPSSASPNANNYPSSHYPQRSSSNQYVPASHYASPNVHAMASSPFLPPSIAAVNTAATPFPTSSQTYMSATASTPSRPLANAQGAMGHPQANGHPPASLVASSSAGPVAPAKSSAVGPPAFSIMPPYAENVPMSRSANPLPPQTPVGPGQALYTTFASRMRTGISTLMQPIPSGPDLQDVLAISRGMSHFGNDYGTTERTRGGGTRRRAAAGMTYYGEEGSDFDDDDDDDDDDAEGQRSGAADGGRGASAAGTPADERGKPLPEEVEEEEEEKPGALLGMPPPGNKIFVKRAHKVHPMSHSDVDLLEQAERAEFLIPIRVELETDTHRIKDTFTWNLREHLIKPRDFARSFVRDLNLSADPYTALVETAIVEQIKLHQASGIDLVHIGPAAGGPWASRARGAKDGVEERSVTLGGADALKKLQRGRRESRQWDWGIRKVANEATWSAGKDGVEFKGQKKRKGDFKEANEDVVLGSGGDHEDDLRVIVDYDVQIYKHHLRDRLEWDLASPLTPEAFAAQLSKDLALTGEALPIVSNAIREQLLMHSRAAQECDLIGKAGEFAKWQAEIDDADAEEAENRRRQRLGMEALPLKPLQAMPEIVEEEQDPLLELAPRRGRPPRRLVEERERLEREREERLQQQREQLLQLQQQQQQAKEQQQLQRQQQLEQQSRQVAASVAQDELRASSDAQGLSTAVSGSEAGTPTLPKTAPTVVLRTPAQRKSVAQFYQSQLTERGSRRLEGVWRDYHDSKEFGPLLEMLTEEELERIEQEAVRASRRGRRDQQRNVRVRRR